MNSSLSSSLGTRHRAAIGLTEETDAAVLIVSEERREISLSYRGQLIRGANEDIRKALLDVFAGNIPDAIREKETKDTYRKTKLKKAKKTTETSDDLKTPDNTPVETNKG